jgi:hypothetical protein
MKGKRRCGFCNFLNIPPAVDPILRGGLMICEACESEYKNIFTTLNNLAKVRNVLINHLER